MYRFELEDTLPFKLDDTIVEHEIYPMKDSSLVFAAIAPNRFISSYLDYLKSLGLDPDWLTFDGMGSINLFSAAKANAETTQVGPNLLLDIGHNKTTLSILNEGRIEAFRSFSWGGFAITQNIAINTGLPLEHAEQEQQRLDLNKLLEGSDVDEMTTSAERAINLLITELNHSLIAYRNQTKNSIASIHLVGGTSLMKGLPKLLSSRLGKIPCSVFNPLDHFPIKEELRSNIQLAKFAEVWGRGNVFSRKSPLLFNFRRNAFWKHTSLDEISGLLKNPNIIKLAQYGSTLVFILLIHVTASSYFAEQESLKANEELKKVFQDTFKNAPKPLKNTLLSNPDKLKDYIDQKNKEMEQKLKMVSKSRESIISLIKTITRCFPETIKVDVNKLEINDRNLIMEGVLYQGDLNLVSEALKKLPALTELGVTQEGQRFSFKAKVTGR
jgi:cell division ATPase FtsA